MQTAHCINYADPAIKGDGAKSCQAEIVRFVRGVRRPRQAPVTARQIKQWLRVTPADFVDAQIDNALIAGRIHIAPRSLGSTRRASGSYVYTASEEGMMPVSGCGFWQ